MKIASNSNFPLHKRVFLHSHHLTLKLMNRGVWNPKVTHSNFTFYSFKFVPKAHTLARSNSNSTKKWESVACSKHEAAADRCRSR